MRSTGLRHLHGLRSKEEVVERTILSHYLSLFSQDCYNFVAAKNPRMAWRLLDWSKNLRRQEASQGETDLGVVDNPLLDSAPRPSLVEETASTSEW